MQQFNGSMVNDNVMGLITQLSRYKAELRGKVYHEIGRFENRQVSVPLATITMNYY
jgi:putative transposase